MADPAAVRSTLYLVSAYRGQTLAALLLSVTTFYTCCYIYPTAKEIPTSALLRRAYQRNMLGQRGPALRFFQTSQSHVWEILPSIQSLSLYMRATKQTSIDKPCAMHAQTGVSL